MSDPKRNPRKSRERNGPDRSGFGHHPQADEAVVHGVELGYRVIDKYIREGRHVAQSLSDNRENRDHPGSEAGSDDLEELIERLFRLSKSLIPEHTEIEAAFAWGRNFLRQLANQRPGRASGAQPVSVEIVSSRPTRVRLDLRAHSGRLTLRGGAPRSLDSGRIPLSGVTFGGGDGADSTALRVRVAHDQPAGIYTAAVVDSGSGKRCGTLSVRIAAG